jgi:hypothetical protein
LILEQIDFFEEEKEIQRSLPEEIFDLKSNHVLLFKLVDCSAISLNVNILVTKRDFLDYLMK